MQNTAKIDPPPATLLIISKCDADDGQTRNGYLARLASTAKAGTDNEGVACADDEFHYSSRQSSVPLPNATRFIIDAVSTARCAAPAALIVALTNHADAGFEERVVAAGADICGPMDIAASQLRTLLQHARLTKTTGPHWQLIVRDRLLRTPDGRTLALTASEILFLLRLTDGDHHSAYARVGGQSGQDNARQAYSSDPMSTAWHARAGSAAASIESAGTKTPATQTPSAPSAPASRSTTVLLSRLRRKAQCQGICLPISAVRGCGYMFLAPVKRIDP